jgi:hypothetical protein
VKQVLLFNQQSTINNQHAVTNSHFGSPAPLPSSSSYYKIASLPAFQPASPSSLFQLGEDELLGPSLLVWGGRGSEEESECENEESGGATAHSMVGLGLGLGAGELTALLELSTRDVDVLRARERAPRWAWGCDKPSSSDGSPADCLPTLAPAAPAGAGAGAAAARPGKASRSTSGKKSASASASVAGAGAALMGGWERKER